MSIASEIQRINTNIENAYSKVSEKGGTLPATQNSANLASSIDSIPAGSTGFPPDWTELGYQGTPQVVIDDFNYSKEVKANWTSSKTFKSDFKIAYVPEIDTSARTNFQSFFDGARRLIYLPNLDTSNGTNFQDMFRNCSSLTTIPLLDTSNGTTFQMMFNSCSSLTSIPNLDTSSGTTFLGTFSNCSSLTSIPNLDTSNGKNFSQIFYGCTSLTSIPNLDTSSGTTFSFFFYNCKSLISIPNIDVSKSRDFQSMFASCNSLTNEGLNKILALLLTATNYTGTKTLKQVGLSSRQATTCQSLSNWDNFVAAGWSTGY